MANVGVRPTDAPPGAGLRLRCVNRADNVPSEEGRRRHARRPGDEAIGGEMQPKTILALVLSSVCVAGCATRSSDSETDRAVAEMIKVSFRTRGQATIDRLNQDEVQSLCSKYKGEPPEDARRRIEKSQQAILRYPGSGKMMGDWREGQRIAQSGAGRQFTDDPARPAGGSGYNCNQLRRQERSFGTIGPSLYQFGKLRGPSEAIQKDTYGKVS